MEVSDELVRASTGLGAGLGFSRKTCAALIAAALALGLKYGRTDRSSSRRNSWSRVARLVERFEKQYHTVSCAKITKKFGLNVFSSSKRVKNCMDVIDFTTQETAHLIFDPDDTFADHEKETYFVKREGERLSD